MKVSGCIPVTHALIIAGLIAVVSSLIFIGGSATSVQADSTFDPTVEVRYCNNLAADFPSGSFVTDIGSIDAELAGDGVTSGGKTTDCDVTPGEDLGLSSTTADLSIKLSVPSGDLNFAPPYFINFIPNAVTINESGDAGADGLGSEIPVGEKVGALTSLATLGVINQTCAATFPVPFKFYNGALPATLRAPRPSPPLPSPPSPSFFSFSPLLFCLPPFFFFPPSLLFLFPLPFLLSFPPFLFLPNFK